MIIRKMSHVCRFISIICLFTLKVSVAQIGKSTTLFVIAVLVLVDGFCTLYLFWESTLGTFICHWIFGSILESDLCPHPPLCWYKGGGGGSTNRFLGIYRIFVERHISKLRNMVKLIKRRWVLLCWISSSIYLQCCSLS